jgi:glycosyltransferase involved in cell wall biosynthesis
MKIALITDSYVPAPNGTSISVEIIRRSLEKSGHDAWVFAPEYKNLRIKENKIVTMPGVFSISDKYKPKIWPINSPKPSVIKEAGFDIVHSHHFYAPNIYAANFAETAGVPHVATLYKHFPEYENKKATLSISTPFQKSVRNTLALANSCSRVIALSSYSKTYFENLGVSTPIETIPVGIFTKDYASYPPQAVREKFKIPKQRKIILYVARLEEDANLEFLLRAFKLIWKGIDDVHLLIIGGGSREQELKNVISHQAFQDYVTVSGFLPKQQVNKIYGAADLFIYPKDLDPQPLCVTESLAAGTPVVAIKGPAEDFIKHHQNGLITPEDVEKFAKAVTELLRRDQLRLDFSMKARLYSRDFRSSNTTYFLLKLYESVLANKETKMF